jgi:hypothetical protein
MADLQGDFAEGDRIGVLLDLDARRRLDVCASTAQRQAVRGRWCAPRSFAACMMHVRVKTDA